MVYVQQWVPRTGALTVISVWGDSDWLKNIDAAGADKVEIGRTTLDRPSHHFLGTEEIAEVERRFRQRDRVIAWGQAKLMGWPWPATPEQLTAVSEGLRGVEFNSAS